MRTLSTPDEWGAVLDQTYPRLRRLTVKTPNTFWNLPFTIPPELQEAILNNIARHQPTLEFLRVEGLEVPLSFITVPKEWPNFKHLELDTNLWEGDITPKPAYIPGSTTIYLETFKAIGIRAVELLIDCPGLSLISCSSLEYLQIDYFDSQWLPQIQAYLSNPYSYFPSLKCLSISPKMGLSDTHGMRIHSTQP